MSHTNDDYRRVLAEGRHAKACFDVAQEQAVRLAKQVDELAARVSELQDTLDLNNDEFARIHGITTDSEIKGLCDRARRRTKQTVPMIEQLEKAQEQVEAFKRLRDELIELNDRLKTEKNHWITKAVERDNFIADLERERRDTLTQLLAAKHKAEVATRIMSEADRGGVV